MRLGTRGTFGTSTPWSAINGAFEEKEFLP